VTAPAASGVGADRGWWRRNRWGLIALVPALALAIGTDVYEMYQQHEIRHPLDPVSSAPGAWVDYHGSRLRLSGLAPIPAPTDSRGRALPLPPGVTAWRGTVDVQLTSKDALSGCMISVIDQRGHTYAAVPAELFRMKDAGLAFCSGDPDAKDPTRFSLQTTFVLAAGARPAAVRVVAPQDLPRYARLLPP